MISSALPNMSSFDAESITNKEGRPSRLDEEEPMDEVIPPAGRGILGGFPPFLFVVLLFAAVGIESIVRYRTQTRVMEEHQRLDMDLGQQDRWLAIASFVIFTFLFVTKHKVLFARFLSFVASSSNQSSRRDQSELWTLHGAQYDLYDFMDRHPGGKEAIELGKGRDCTALFESYHPFTSHPR
jgi:hypothetical protein